MTVTNFVPEGPQPLLREIAPPGDFPVSALGPLQAAVEAAAGETQAPIAIAAGSALAVGSLAVQAHADVLTLGGIRPLSLYVLSVAASGERKSSVDRLLMAGLREVEEIEAEAYAADFERWTRDQKIFAAKEKAALAGLGGKKSAIAEVDLQMLGPEPAAPVIPYRTMSEPTLEGMFRSFLYGQPSQGLFSDEGGAFLAGHAMNQDNRTKTLAGLNALWDGTPIDRTRAGDGCFRLFGRRLAQHLMVQPAVAHAFLSDGLAADTGFLPRCLMAEPASTIGSRFSNTAAPNPNALDAHAARLKAILCARVPMADDGRSLKPRLLKMSPDARKLLTEYADEIEGESGPGRAFSHITGAAAKSAEQACRLAGVMTLWDNLDAVEITEQMMANGIELARYYLSEGSRLSSAATISAEIAAAEKLRKWLLAHWPEADVAKVEITNRGPSCCRESPKADAACAILERHGWLLANPEGHHLRGKPRKQSWRIVRG
jgi:hypothetical protein